MRESIRTLEYENLKVLDMDVQFTPEQEARLLQIADYSGTPAEQLVKSES